DTAVHCRGHFLFAEYDYGRTYGESFASREPGLYAGRQQGPISVRGEPVLDELEYTEQFDLGVQDSEQRDAAVYFGPAEQSLSYWSGPGMHGGGPLEQVRLHLEWRWDGHGQGAG